MSKNVVLTLTGRDRVGLVERVTEVVLNCGGNIESSRMARLGGEFAMLMHVTVPEDRLRDLEQDSRHLESEGFAVTARQTEAADPAEYAGWVPHQVEVTGADHEGIIHSINAVADVFHHFMGKNQTFQQTVGCQAIGAV